MSDDKNCFRMDNAKNLHLIFDQLRPHLKMAATLITAVVLFSGCTKSLFGLIKSDGRNQTSSPQSTLIKPKIDDSPVTQDSLQKASDSIDNNTKSPEKDSNKTPEAPAPAKDPARKPLDDPPQAPSEEIVKTPKRLTGAEQGQFPEGKDQKRGDKPALPVRDTKDSDEDEMHGVETEERNPSFKKHDHSKYLTTIKNSAIDVVNKEPDSVYARMCKHNTSEEWSLSLYFVQAKNYYFRIYVWDPIENIWAETFESEKRPIAGYKKHLSFSLAGKKCISLKGSEKE